jgi:hypothetical protein
MDSKDRIDIYRELQKALQERKNKQLVFQTDSITIEVDVLNNWVCADWKGYQDRESVETGCTHLLEALQKFDVSKVLNMNTNMHGDWKTSIPWISETWFPKMIEAGLKKFAWIYSPGELSHYSADQTIKQVSAQYSIRTFDSVDEGKRWLKGEASAMPGDGNTF